MNDFHSVPTGQANHFAEVLNAVNECVLHAAMVLVLTIFTSLGRLLCVRTCFGVPCYCGRGIA